MRGSVVTVDELDNQRSILCRSRTFSLRYQAWTSYGAQSAPYPVKTEGIVCGNESARSINPTTCLRLIGFPQLRIREVTFHSSIRRHIVLRN